MDHDRRTFLKTTSLAAAAAASQPARRDRGRRADAPRERASRRSCRKAWRSPRCGGRTEMATVLGFAPTAACSTSLPPSRISASARRPPSMRCSKARATSMGSSAWSTRRARARPPSVISSPLDKAAFGPCVTNPEKIICIGLNYRKHIAEMNAQVPKMPVLFSKYNTALNNHGGTVGVSETDGVQFDYEAELVIVLGRTARNVSEADAAKCIFGYCHRQRLHRPRPAAPLEPMADRQEPRRLGAGGAVAGHRRSRRRRQSQDRMPGERRGAAVLQHRRHGVQLQAARQLHLEIFHAQARRHHLHRHAGGRHRRLSRRTSRSGSSPATRSSPRSRSSAS